MAINIRFKGIIGTLAQIITDRFAGRIAWMTDISRFIMYYDATNYGVMARRDVLESFEAGIQDATVTAGQPMVAGTSGRYQTQDAATFRTTIGAASATNVVTREAAVRRLPGNGVADPALGNWVDGNMQVPHWGTNAGTVDRAYFAIDIDYNYIAGTDLVFHVHWGPITGAGGNVKWQAYVQWGESGATWVAATLSTATTAAGTVAWADKRTDITLSGTGHTYNSRVLVHLFRDRNDAADTYEAAVGELSVSAHFQADPLQAG